jgi:hypothetical protein
MASLPLNFACIHSLHPVEIINEISYPGGYLLMVILIADVVVFGIDCYDRKCVHVTQPFLMSLMNFLQIIKRNPFLTLSVPLPNSLQAELGRTL